MRQLRGDYDNKAALGSQQPYRGAPEAMEGSTCAKIALASFLAGVAVGWTLNKAVREKVEGWMDRFQKAL